MQKKNQTLNRVAIGITIGLALFFRDVWWGAAVRWVDGFNPANIIASGPQVRSPGVGVYAVGVTGEGCDAATARAQQNAEANQRYAAQKSLADQFQMVHNQMLAQATANAATAAAPSPAPAAPTPIVTRTPETTPVL